MTYLNKNLIKHIDIKQNKNFVMLWFGELLVLGDGDPTYDITKKFETQDELNQFINELNDSTKLFIKI